MTTNIDVATSGTTPGRCPHRGDPANLADPDSLGGRRPMTVPIIRDAIDS